MNKETIIENVTENTTENTTENVNEIIESIDEKVECPKSMKITLGAAVATGIIGFIMYKYSEKIVDLIHKKKHKEDDCEIIQETNMEVEEN